MISARGRRRFSPPRWLGRGLTAGLAAAMFAGLVQPGAANAAEPPITITDAQLSGILFSSAERIKAAGVDYDKQVVLSAELLDFVARNPTAPETVLAAHVTELRAAVDAKVTGADLTSTTADRLRKLLLAVAAVPDAVLTGPQLGSLLGVVTARDATAGILSREQRITGTQQNLDVEPAYTVAARAVLQALHDKSALELAVADVWVQQFGAQATGQPFALNPLATTSTLKALPVLSGLIDVDAITTAAAQGKTALLTTINVQYQNIVTSENTLTGNAVTELTQLNLTITPPGAGNADQAAVDAALKEAGQYKQAGDQLKSGIDGLTSVAKLADPAASAFLTEYGAAAAQLAVSVFTLISAVETIGAAASAGATLGAYGAAIGAIIGIVEVFANVALGTDGTAAAIKALLQTVTKGFQQMQDSLKKINDNMKVRFDHVDDELNTIYNTMTADFATVINQVQTIGTDVHIVHEDLLSLQSTLEGFNKQILDSLQANEKIPFLLTVGQYVDYPALHNGASITDPTQFDTATSNFETTADTIANQAGMVTTDMSAPPQSALSLGGVAAIDWLANHANSTYGTHFAVGSGATATPNADMWAEAARAYYVTALQNPAMTAAPGPARLDNILRNGVAINAAAAQFSTPTAPVAGQAWTATNPLFTALLSDNATATQTMLNHIPAPSTWPDVVDTLNRPWDLWGSVSQISASDTTKLNDLPAAPTSMPSCDGSHPATSEPTWAGPKNMTPPSWLVQYLDPQDFAYSSCFYGAYYLPASNSYIGAFSCHPVHDDNPACDYRWERATGIRVNVVESIQHNGATVVQQTTLAGAGIVNCTWDVEAEKGTVPPMPPVPSDCAPSPTDDPTHHFNGAGLNQGQDSVTVANDGSTIARHIMDQRAAAYYAHVAQSLQTGNDIWMTNLNNNVQLIQAYVGLGFAHGVQSDDQLRALVFGTHNLANNLPVPGNPNSESDLALAYQEASVSIQADQPVRPEILDDAAPALHHAVCGIGVPAETDPLTYCMTRVLPQRPTRLAASIEAHEQQIYNGTEQQGLPLVNEVLDNLRLTRQFVVQPGAPAPAVRHSRLNAV
jgi:hypothetical protein